MEEKDYITGTENTEPLPPGYHRHSDGSVHCHSHGEMDCIPAGRTFKGNTTCLLVVVCSNVFRDTKVEASAGLVI